MCIHLPLVSLLNQPVDYCVLQLSHGKQEFSKHEGQGYRQQHSCVLQSMAVLSS